MKGKFSSIVLGAALGVSAGFSMADTASDALIGTWKTETSEEGYLHVDIESCDDRMCGTIIAAFNTQDEPGVDYEHLGKPMIWDMKAAGDNKWSKGKIWDPSADKTYKSKMVLNGDTLEVSGCIAVFCKSQVWQRLP